MVPELDAFMARLHAALFDREACTLVIRCKPVTLDLAVRMARGVMDGPDLRMVAYPAPAAEGSAEAFFAQWVEQATRALDSERIDLEMLDPGDGVLAGLRFPSVDAALPLEERYAAWFEQASAALLPIKSRTAWVVFVDDSAPSALLDVIWRVARLVVAPWCKFVIFDATSAGVGDGVTRSLPRWTTSALSAAEGDPRPRMTSASRADRVLVATCGPANLAALAHDARLPTFWIREPYTGRVPAEKSVWAQLSSEAGEAAQSAALSRPACGLHPSSLELMILAELVRASRTAGPMLLVLDVRPVAQPDFVAAWIRDWSRTAVFGRCRLAIVDPDGALAAALGDPTLPIERIPFSFGVPEIGRAMKATAEAADTPDRVRLRARLALAGMASGEGQFAAALEHCAEAHRLAASGTPTDRAEVFWTEGQTHYRGQAFAKAEDAFRRGIDAIAADPRSPMLPQLCLGVANTTLCLGDYGDAGSFYATASELARALGNLIPSLASRVWAAEAARRAGERAVAERELRQVLGDVEGLGPDLADGAAALRAQVLERLARLCDEADDRRAEARELHELAGQCGCDAHVPELP